MTNSEIWLPYFIPKNGCPRAEVRGIIFNDAAFCIRSSRNKIGPDRNRGRLNSSVIPLFH